MARSLSPLGAVHDAAPKIGVGGERPGLYRLCVIRDRTSRSPLDSKVQAWAESREAGTSPSAPPAARPLRQRYTAGADWDFGRMLRVGPARATGTAGTTTAGSYHAGTPRGPGPASAVLYRGSLGAEGRTWRSMSTRASASPG
jgi:hypothetical protein